MAHARYHALEAHRSDLSPLGAVAPVGLRFLIVDHVTGISTANEVLWDQDRVQAQGLSFDVHGSGVVLPAGVFRITVYLDIGGAGRYSPVYGAGAGTALTTTLDISPGGGAGAFQEGVDCTLRADGTSRLVIKLLQADVVDPGAGSCRLHIREVRTSSLSS